MGAIFLLTWRALVRGRLVWLLLAAVALVHARLPALVRSDGSPAGAREMWLRAVPGAVEAIVLLVTLVVACGLFAREREAKRLALSLVRPVSGWALACGKWLALVCVAGMALAFSAAATLLFPPGPCPPCRHHYTVQLPPAEVVAGHLLESYLADPATPEAVKKASRRAVLTLLTTRESDRYDVIPPGGKMVWPFDQPALRRQMAAGSPLVLGVRFATQFETRATLAGRLELGSYAAAVSNVTQAVLEIPLTRATPAREKESLDLVFENTGPTPVMLRPRRDLFVLAPADAFAGNLLRAHLEVWAMAAALAAWGLFLSAALSRPVAVFTAVATWLAALVAPSVIVQFPDEFNAAFADRLGLALSRAIAVVTSSVSEASPIADLATGRAIEWREVVRLIVGNVLVAPIFLLGASAFIARRKPLPDNE